MGRNKIIFAGETLIDLTADSVTEDKLLSGITAHNKAGDPITGTCTFDSDTSDANVEASEVLNTKTFYARGGKGVGTMPNNGAVTHAITTKTETYTIPMGFHDGSGIVSIDATEQAKVIPENIKEGVVILGVTGASKPSSSVTAQAKTATPGKEAQTILPDAGTDYLSQVTVAAIPYSETENSAGGTTVTIAG